MKKFTITIFVLLFGFLLITQIPDLFYTVNAAQNAIILQDGKIIGEPKGPGLHFKIPYLHEVYKIDVQLIKKISLSFPNRNTLQAIILWQVKNPKKYYMVSHKMNFNLELESIVRPVFNKTLKNYDSDAILQIQEGQQKDPYFSNSQHNEIKAKLQDVLEEYVVSIYNIFIRNN